MLHHGCSLTRLPDKFFNFKLDGWYGIRHWSDAGDGFPVLVDDKFGEIPLDPGTEKAALLLLQPFPQRCCIFTIHIHLASLKIGWQWNFLRFKILWYERCGMIGDIKRKLYRLIYDNQNFVEAQFFLPPNYEFLVQNVSKKVCLS